MIPNEMKSWREVMDDVARLTKERDEARCEVERLRNLYDDAKQSANAWRSVRGISEREHELERQLAEAHAEISRMREVESADLRAARDDAIRLGQEAEALRETLRTVSDVPSGWQADDEVTYAIDQLCEAAYAFASDKDNETPLEDHETAKAERVAVEVLKATIGKRIEAATAGLRKERDEALAEVEKIKAREAEGVAIFDDLLARERAEVARLRSLPPERVTVHKVTQTGEHFCETQCEKRKQLDADCDQWRKDYNLQTHKVITCGVAADHPDPKLTLRDDYMQWNSPQAERVRALRERADKAEAEVARLRASQNERAIAELEKVRNWLSRRETNSGFTAEYRQCADHAGEMVEANIACLRAEQADAPAPVTPPDDAPSRPSVEGFDLGSWLYKNSMQCDHGYVLCARCGLWPDGLNDALAARGGAK